MRMDQTSNESGQNSLDLLSAALNQSGLTMLDSPPVSVNNDNEDLLASLMTTIGPDDDDVPDPILESQVVKAPPKQQRTVQVQVPVTSFANVVKTAAHVVKPTVIKTTSMPKVITIGGNGVIQGGVQKPIGRIVTISNKNGKNPAKIFKVSLPDKSRVGNGPCIIKLPISGKGSSSNLPILISKQNVAATLNNKIVVSTSNSPRIVKGVPNTVIARTAIVPPTTISIPNGPRVIGAKNNQISTPNRTASPSFIISKTKVAVKTKTIIQNGNKVVKQVPVMKTNMRKSNLNSSELETELSKEKISKNGLNLGSLFVENVENSALRNTSTLNDIIPNLSPNIVEDRINNNIPYKFNTQPAKVNAIYRQQSVPASLCNIVDHEDFEANFKLTDFIKSTVIESRNKRKMNASPTIVRECPSPINISKTETTKTIINKSVSAKKFYKNENSQPEDKMSFNDAYKRKVQKTQDDLLLDEEQKEEESGHANTYAEYKPSKLKIGLPHPDSVVETSSLASVPPPDVHYKLSIPEETIDHGLLSALQLEAITYACQQTQILLPSGERAGFLIGDGAGVGKGRTIAGIICENYLIGRKKSLWFSVSNDLKYDAERDLRDIGAKNIKIHPLNKFKYGKISSKENNFIKKGVIFATYSSLIGESHKSGKYGTRLKQILQWCGKDFDGPIIFDECHKAKNLVQSGSSKSTKTGLTVLELQKLLPKARVIYASATGASEPKNMAYMSRLGLWGPGTPFKQFNNFIQAVERRGVGAMEMVAMDLKLRGSYMARQLSFHGVSFKINEVELPSSFIRMYNQCVKLWVAAHEAFQLAAKLMDAEYHMKKTMWGQFWSAHQRFFKYLCIASKVNQVSHMSREAVKHGKCVVIGLQSTGEARTVDQLEKMGGELDDFVSTAKGVFENLIEKHFPAPNRKRITELLGKDFYGKNNSNKGGKRKMDATNDKSAKRSKLSSSHMSEGGSSSSEDEEDNQLSSFLHDSVDSSDEDIGKIFGGGSDSEEEWGSSSPKPKKKLPVKKKLSEDEEADKLLEQSGLKAGFKKTAVVGMNEMSDGDDTSDRGVRSCLNACMSSVEKTQAMKRYLLNKLESLDRILPNNTLDELIEGLGGQENVAEMTGRKGRVVSTVDGGVQYESRSENDVKVDMLNMAEKQRFMDGEKNIAIISEAASSGISLQADRRVRNQRKRVHFTLELPWSADKAIQQFGRTHRSNQVHAPEYIFLISQLAGEQRFASIVAKRLESLGALTHGDRRATETRDLSKYNFDNKYGRVALESILKAILELEEPLVPTPEEYGDTFMEDIRKAMVGVGLFFIEEDGSLQLDKDYGNISKFMNRILGMEVAQQNALFQFFTDTLQHIIREVKKQGQYDRGILDLGSSGETVERLNIRKFRVKTRSVERDEHICGYVELHTLKVERGMPWNEAEQLWNDVCNENDDGFYVTQLKRHGKCMAVLAVEYFNKRWRQRTDRDSRLFTIYRPSTGKQLKLEKLSTLETKYRKVPATEAQEWWNKQHEASSRQCTHAYWQGMCFRFVQGEPCNVGKRQRTCHVLSGNVLAVWNLVEHVLSYGASTFHKMQIIRLKIENGKLVGLLIPSNCVPALILSLNKGTLSAPDATPLPTLARSQSTPAFDNNIAKRISEIPDDIPSEEEFNDSEEDEDDISPDDMNLSVLFPRKY